MTPTSSTRAWLLSLPRAWAEALAQFIVDTGAEDMGFVGTVSVSEIKGKSYKQEGLI